MKWTTIRFKHKNINKPTSKNLIVSIFFFNEFLSWIYSELKWWFEQIGELSMVIKHVKIKDSTLQTWTWSICGYFDSLSGFLFIYFCQKLLKKCFSLFSAVTRVWWVPSWWWQVACLRDLLTSNYWLNYQATIYLLFFFKKKFWHFVKRWEEIYTKRVQKLPNCGATQNSRLIIKLSTTSLL